MKMIDQFAGEAVQLKLDKLFNQQHYFSICDVREIAKLIGANPELHPDYPVLQTLHCVDYASMSAQMRAELPSRVMGVLACKVDTGLMTKALLAVANNEVNDLPPIEDVEVSTRGNPKRLTSFFRG